MENIVVDAATGDIAVKTLVKHVQPHLHGASVLKGVHRMLSSNQLPELAKRLINGRQTCVAPLELCYHIIDKMKGRRWDEWRQASGPRFKEALCEHVEHVCASSAQEQQPQRMDEEEQQVEESVEQNEAKASIMQKALRAVNINGSVRIDDNINEASVIDVVKMLCPGVNSNNAAFMLARVIKRDTEEKAPHGVVDVPCQIIPLAERVHYIKINGTGHLFAPEKYV